MLSNRPRSDSGHAARPLPSRTGRVLLGAGLVPTAALALLVSTAATAQPNAAPRGWSESPGEASESLEEWREQLANAMQRVQTARTSAEEASDRYTRARTRRYPRGDALDALRERHTSTLDELRAAESDFSLLLERARRDGVPTGILADYFDFEEELASRRDALENANAGDSEDFGEYDGITETDDF